MFSLKRVSTKIYLLKAGVINSLRCLSEYDLWYDQDPSPLFLDNETQSILKSVTQYRLDKIFHNSLASNCGVEYKLMTNVELNEKLQSVKEFARRKFRMIPVVKVSDEKTHTIFCDRPLTGFSEARFIISDVTYGLNQSLRTVITRQTSGNLEHVSMNTSKRVNQLYFPLNGRQIKTPFMLKGEYLEKCLNDKKYEFVLDRLIVQFEPYEKEFHDISGKVYIHINKTGQFDILRSTRHFGPMAFFLAWHKCIDDLLFDMIKRNYIKNCVEIIALMYKLHGIEKDYKSIMLQLTEIQNTLDIGINNIQNYFSPGRVPTSINDNIGPAFSKPSNKILERCIRFIEDYINQHSFKKNQLELSLQTFKELLINQHI